MRRPRRSAHERGIGALCGLLALGVALGGCASPSPTYSDYRAKVAATAKEMVSVINSATLAAQAWEHHRVMHTYADTVVSNAEQDANSVVTTIDSRQPPNEAAIRLKDLVDSPLQDASSALTDLRIALRRDDTAGVREALGKLEDPLKTFTELQQRES